ncbi:hypothetical protein [Escherichia coli]|uniref:hypothetical protein n=1 Tax=Escherichia coli TaxID=562 RepID=UPI0024884A22|nr:hypothetical protein [Escherichia coli]MED6536263.1 hypothetical protein [Escherichia coli O157]MED6562249.1 hypothetical protein [Escherichia coli O157]MED6572973.1 hypothetical protein [Escherichia coli O157]MED6826931.1 hypothetical protein [Escherichia coli O157]
MQNEMIYLTYNEYVERLVSAKRYTNQLPHNPNQTPEEKNAEALFQALPYLLGTDRQEYHVERIIKSLKITIKEKIHETLDR